MNDVSILTPEMDCVGKVLIEKVLFLKIKGDILRYENGMAVFESEFVQLT